MKHLGFVIVGAIVGYAWAAGADLSNTTVTSAFDKRKIGGAAVGAGAGWLIAKIVL